MKILSENNNSNNNNVLRELEALFSSAIAVCPLNSEPAVSIYCRYKHGSAINKVQLQRCLILFEQVMSAFT